MDTHIIKTLGDGKLAGFKRDGLQTFLDERAASLSFSVVDHLRWDLRQIFTMAVAEGMIERSPAELLFTPKQAKRAQKRTMTIKEVIEALSVLDLRERLIVKLAVVSGMRPGEILALKWGRIKPTHVEIAMRVYKGDIDTPKTTASVRSAALSEGVAADIEAWRRLAVSTDDDAWVFPSERLSTPLAKDNCWRRSILPKFESIGLAWANFQVMRRTHSTLMHGLGVDPKLVADQLGHSLDVNQNVYTIVPVERRREAIGQLEAALAC